MRVLSVSVLLLLGAVGCGAQRTSDSDWEYVTPMEMGLEPALMQALEEAVTSGRFTNLHGVVVVKGGRLVLDAYAPGVDSADLHYTASVTKSVGSLLLGMAMDRGLMPGLEDGVLDLGLADLFPEHGEILTEDPRKAAIRLRHILSMTAGLEWDEDSYPYDDPRNDWVRVRGVDDPVRRVLEQAVDAAPGSVFVYSGGMSALVGALLDRASGGSPRAFAERELFDPLGISEYVWWDLAGGLIDVPGGLHLRPRDMAKIGH
ncbi:MAG: serine hydrolase, partial [Candidatus Krumholzibacteria bacterium]